jgi:hypothetical protein
MTADYQAEQLARQHAHPVVLSRSDLIRASAKDLTAAAESLVAPLDPSLRSG